MATNKLLWSSKLIGVFFIMLVCTLSANAQFLRTSYFMEGTHYRQQLNPALTPTKGYFNLPVIGAFNVAANSNSLGTQDIIDIIDNGDDFYNNQAFMDRLSNENRLNVNLNTDILSFGWYKGKNFWSFNVGARVDIGAQIPKTMFDFLHDIDRDGFSWNNSAFNIGKEELNINAYTEIGVGYARAINDRLTIGGKVKVLLGMGNLNLKVNSISLDANLPEDIANIDPNNLSQLRNYHAKLNVDAHLESSFKGMDLTENTSDPNPRNHYIDDFDFNGFGIAGYGGAIDLGASYKVLDNLTVSAAILDLGLIKWSAGSTNIANAAGNINYDGKDYVDESGNVISGKNPQELIDGANDFLNRVEKGDVLNYDMLQLQKEESKSRTTSLHSTIVFGAEYTLLNNWLAVGALSTTRFAKPKTQTELTLSANIRPKSWFNAAISYSMIQSAGKSFGLAVKVGPLFVGTDYMFFGKNTKSVNGFLGISIPLGGKKANKEG